MATAFLGSNSSLRRNRNTNNNLSNLPFKQKIKYDNLHLKERQLKILNENKFKSGIYLIYNNINGKFYIGSAITNRINVRFRNHGTGSSILHKSIKKYGLENFSFFILEYYKGFIHKENLNKNHLDLLSIETKYINLLNPAYNILTVGGSSYGYKHNKETIEKIKSNYSEERKNRIGLLNKDKNLSQSTKNLLSQKAKIRYLETDYKEFLRTKFSKPLLLYNKDGTIHSEQNSIKECCKHFKCCTKTINKAIKNNTI